MGKTNLQKSVDEIVCPLQVVKEIRRIHPDDDDLIEYAERMFVSFWLLKYMDQDLDNEILEKHIVPYIHNTMPGIMESLESTEV